MLSSPSVHRLLAGKTLLIFDFDGTIADTSSLHAIAFSETLRPLGVEPDYPSIAGLKTADAIRKCLAAKAPDASHSDIERLVSIKQAIVRELITTQLMPLPGITCFLERAHKHFQLALATSGSRGTVNLALHKLGYESIFSSILSAEDVISAKPSPEIFLKTLDRMRQHQEDAFIFEDSEAGLLAAKQAGIDCHDIRTSGWQPFTSYAEAFWR